MLEYSLAHWAAFLTTAVLLNLSPGPDMAFVLGHTIRGGRRAGFSAVFGVWSGAFMHVLFAAFGLSVVLVASAVAFSAVKWIGAAYLIWLGVQALRSAGEGGFVRGAAESMSRFRIYRQGVFVSLLNPKLALFFPAFLPQFIVEGAGPAWLQLSVHGALIIFVAMLVEPPLILMGGKLADVIKGSRKVALWLDRGLGALFIALGVRLALTIR